MGMSAPAFTKTKVDDASAVADVYEYIDTGLIGAYGRRKSAVADVYECIGTLELGNRLILNVSCS